MIMHTQDTCFHHFPRSAAHDRLPEKFTFPFCYEPHPLSELAAEALQRHLQTQTDWQHNFGLSGEMQGAIGKMFGVLVVRNSAGELGYLAAFSGKLADSNHLPGFVPPVFDMLKTGGFFLTEQARVNEINHQLETLERHPDITLFHQRLNEIQTEEQQQLANFREQMIEGRKRRKSQRHWLEQSLLSQDIGQEVYQQQMLCLSQESVAEKLRLREYKQRWEKELAEIRYCLEQLTAPIDALKEQRKTLSKALQKKLFAQYRFLNQAGQEKDLGELFQNTVNRIPPAGSGECAAPKLLQYAFMHKMQPLAMAEFWWGQSPKSEIRRHKHYYPSCSGKCQPILAHMLDGMDIDDNPLLVNPAKNKPLQVVYQDDAIAVVNKPAEMLSVPGKSIQDSVYQRVRQLFPQATGSLIVHRLDMSTSGLMVIALSGRAHKHLQKQFISRSVRKRYVALVDGIVEKESGSISLPMRGDPHDRPRQLVCFRHGKPADTYWEVCERYTEQTKVYLYPKTGRTHQLRVHCAHPDGLNMPIAGDDLYGQRAERLYLHADSLRLIHPLSGKVMHFIAESEF